MRELRDRLEELACRAGLDGLPRPAAVAGIVLACVLVSTAAWRWGPWAVPAGDVVAPEGAASVQEAGPSQPESVTVHVVGAVSAPGVFALPIGSRVRDAVDAAGGLRDDAESSGVNLARVLSDGEQVAIPVKGAAGAVGGASGAAGGASGPSAAAPGGKVNLNTGDAAALDTLPGIGPATAAKIIQDREENGPFRRPEDLMRVPGIGVKRFESLKDLVTTG